MNQLKLGFATKTQETMRTPYRERLLELLDADLDFHGADSAYASHNYHAFPAKFPPQLPRVFIEGLTHPGDIVLDPMVGSGTTAVEAFLRQRRPLGVDLDPLALQLCRVKTTPIPIEQTAEIGYEVLRQAQAHLQNTPESIHRTLDARFEKDERDFINYWFEPEIQLELLALIQEIERITQPAIREFIATVFSAIIITKSGGVSQARDLAHTRPHRVTDKPRRAVFNEFSKRLKKNLESAANLPQQTYPAQFIQGNALRLPLADNGVDLIVTSPPYASNAIDYMRAHKFSLIWFGHGLAQLRELRGQYIGHDAIANFGLLPLPGFVQTIVEKVVQQDAKKAAVLHRYYSEAVGFLGEMYRVLKPGRAAIVVVGPSTMRGVDTQTGECLAEIGKAIGFAEAHIGIRHLDRDKRMMPARQKPHSPERTSIEARMHEEFVIGFLKA